MKINQAYTTIEGLLSKSDRHSERKIYEQLLGTLTCLKEHDLPTDKLQSLEEALDRLIPEGEMGMKARDLKGRRNRFMKHLRETHSLVPEGYYIAIGLCFGVAFGAAAGSALQGIAGFPAGTSGTGLFVGIGLIAGYVVARYLEIEAKKENRLLIIRTS